MAFNEQDIIRQLENPETRRQAFSILVRQYSEQLYWKIRRIVLTHEDANDVLQEVFLKAWNNLESFQYKSKISTWLYRIAINEALDFLRRQRKVSEVSADDAVSVANHLLADEFFDGDDVQARLQEAISMLPEVQRTVFTLRYYDEMKYSEISKLLDTSEGALKASYHLAVKKIIDFFHGHD